MKTVSTRGGARKGAGRPKKEPTRMLSVRIPVDRYEEIKSLIEQLIPARKATYMVAFEETNGLRLAGSLPIEAYSKEDAQLQAEREFRREKIKARVTGVTKQ